MRPFKNVIVPSTRDNPFTEINLENVLLLRDAFGAKPPYGAGMTKND